MLSPPNTLHVPLHLQRPPAIEIHQPGLEQVLAAGLGGIELGLHHAAARLVELGEGSLAVLVLGLLQFKCIAGSRLGPPAAPTPLHRPLAGAGGLRANGAVQHVHARGISSPTRSG